MSIFFNKTILAGNIGNDPVVRTYEDNNKKCFLRLCVTERFKDRNGEFHEQAEWYKIIGTGRIAERMEQQCHKGDLVLVEGKLRQVKTTDKEGKDKIEIAIIAEKILCQPKARSKVPEENSPEMQPEEFESPE